MTEVEAWKYFAGQALSGYLAGRSGGVSEKNAADKASAYADEMTKLFKQRYLAITHSPLPEK